MFGLERRFRCTSPGRHFPGWLREAGLRGRGSVITTARFQAVHDGGGDAPRGYGYGYGCGGGAGGGGEDGVVGNGEEGETEAMAMAMMARSELRTVVGRMLWQEVWGAFVAADRWWWDVPEIVDECVRLGTYWEYSVITACKESGEG